MTVTTRGTTSWHIQFGSAFVPLSATGGPYYARLKVLASAPLTLAALFLRDAVYTVNGLTSLPVTTTVQTLQIGPVTLTADASYRFQVGECVA